MWQTGNRVLAVRPGESFLYPAVIRNIDGDRVTVEFDDGDQSWVFPEHLQQLNIALGDRVLVRAPIGREYTPAQVKRADSEKLYVEHEDGEPEWTTVGMIRIDPKAWKDVYEFSAKDGDWNIGDRVLAQWFDALWYPATVEETDGERVRVNYDDGDIAWIGMEHVRAIDLAEGERVLARWQGGATYAWAVIDQIQGEDVFLNYEDGREEWSTIAVVRVQRESEAPPPQPEGGLMPQWKVGDIVLSLWGDRMFLYPAVIKEIENNRVFVHYLDGDRSWVPMTEIVPLDIREGDFVFARWNKGKYYFPATINQINGQDIHLRYNDGREEWSTFAVVRIPIGPPPGQPGNPF